MTTKDYEVLAGVMIAALRLAENTPSHRVPETVVEQIVHDMCRVFTANSPRFDDSKFRVMCGL